MPFVSRTDPTVLLRSSMVSDEVLLSDCFKNIEGPVTVNIAAVAKSCGIQNHWAINRLQQIKDKHRLDVTMTGTASSKTAKLNAAAIATGGPATTSDKISKRSASFTKKGTARIVKKPKHKLCSATQEEDIAKVNEIEASQEGLTCVVADDSDLSSDLTYMSTTEEDESIPTDENNRIFPGVELSRLDDMGLTTSYLLAVKKAKRTGTMAELMAGETPKEVAKILAAEELLNKAAVLNKAAELK